MPDSTIINNVIHVTTKDSISLEHIAESIKTANDGRIGVDDWLQAIATIIGVVLTGLILYFVNKQTLKNATNNSIREGRVTLYENWSMEIKKNLSTFVTETGNVITSTKEYMYNLTPHIPFSIIEEKAMSHISAAGASSNMVRMFLNVNDPDFEHLNSEIQKLYQNLRTILVEALQNRATPSQLEERLSRYREAESALMVTFDNYLTRKENIALRGE